MLPKSPSAVGCHHCHRLDARQSCRFCLRLICVGCASGGLGDCVDPLPVRYGIGFPRRLLAVDGEGRYAVSFALAPRLLDLQRGAWVETHLPFFSLGPWPLFVRPAGTVASARPVIVSALHGPRSWLGLRVDELAVDGRVWRIETVHCPKAPRGLRLDAEERLVLMVDGSGDLQLIDPCAGVVLDTLGGQKVGGSIVSVAASSVMGLLAVAQPQGVMLSKLDDLARPIFSLRAAARLVGVALAGGRLFVLDDEATLRVYAVPDDGAEVEPSVELTLQRKLSRPRICVSPDGQLLAIGSRRTIELYDLRPVAAGRELRRTLLRRHRGRITLLRFAREGRLLISAATDSRVVVWPTRRALDDEQPSRLVRQRIGRWWTPLL